MPTDEQAPEAAKPDPLAPPSDLTQYKFNFDEFGDPKAIANVLKGRDWTDLTEIDPVLDAARKQEVLELIEKARREADLHFMVVTIKGERLREFTLVARALLSEKLALEEGGVLICTDVPGAQITAYTTLLETHLGRDTLAAADRNAFNNANLAVSNSERGLNLVRTVLDVLTEAAKRLKSGGDSSSADSLFDYSPNVVLTDSQASARKKPAATTATPATGSSAETQTLNVKGASPEARPPGLTQVKSLTGGVKRPSILVPMIAGAGALLILIAAGLLTRLAFSSLRKSRKREQHPIQSELTARRETPPDPLPKTPATGPLEETEANTAVEDSGALSSAANSSGMGIKPRMMDQRNKGRRRTAGSSPRREELRETVDGLEQLAQVNRGKSSTEPFDIDAEIDRLTLQEIQMHYRALFKMVPPSSRPALTESLEDLLDQLREDSGGNAKPRY